MRKIDCLKVWPHAVLLRLGFCLFLLLSTCILPRATQRRHQPRVAEHSTAINSQNEPTNTALLLRPPPNTAAGPPPLPLPLPLHRLCCRPAIGLHCLNSAGDTDTTDTAARLRPNKVSTIATVGNIPFAFFLVDVSRPAGPARAARAAALVVVIAPRSAGGADGDVAMAGGPPKKIAPAMLSAHHRRRRPSGEETGRRVDRDCVVRLIHYLLSIVV